jgi:hypothetical protein
LDYGARFLNEEVSCSRCSIAPVLAISTFLDRNLEMIERGFVDGDDRPQIDHWLGGWHRIIPFMAAVETTVATGGASIKFHRLPSAAAGIMDGLPQVSRARGAARTSSMT